MELIDTLLIRSLCPRDLTVTPNQRWHIIACDNVSIRHCTSLDTEHFPIFSENMSTFCKPIITTEEMNEPVVHFPLTTHILDVTQGVPGRNVAVSLFRQIGETWDLITKRFTDADGRCPGLISAANFQVGIYKLHFDTGKYFKDNNVAGFYPFVEVVFEVKDPFSHYHVPLIISPYSYSTYRGS